MADQPVPAPTRWYILAFNIVIDALLKGIAVEVAFAQLAAAVPWLANPVTKWLISQIFGKVDERVKVVGDKGLIALGNQFRKISYDEALKVIQEHDDATPDQVQAARDAIDRIVHRGS